MIYSKKFQSQFYIIVLISVYQYLVIDLGKRSMWSYYHDARVRRFKTWSEAHTNRIGGLCGGCSNRFSKEVLLKNVEIIFWKIWAKVRRRNLKKDRNRRKKTEETQYFMRRFIFQFFTRRKSEFLFTRSKFDARI
jgi:hypothetical protein